MNRLGRWLLAVALVSQAGCRSTDEEHRLAREPRSLVVEKHTPSLAFVRASRFPEEPVEASARLQVPAPRSSDDVVRTWPQRTRELASRLIEKYGAPHEMTESKLIWRGNGPWKRTVLHKEELRHDFPEPHRDVLAQTIDVRVPSDSFDELAAFDGSLVAGRTSGELTAHCNREEMNFLALNLAHEIVTGKRTVEDARAFLARTAREFEAGIRAPHVDGLLFTPEADTADPDAPYTEP